MHAAAAAAAAQLPPRDISAPSLYNCWGANCFSDALPVVTCIQRASSRGNRSEEAAFIGAFGGNEAEPLSQSAGASNPQSLLFWQRVRFNATPPAYRVTPRRGFV
jgi:hypothetical protein